MTDVQPGWAPRGDDLLLLARCYGCGWNRAGRFVRLRTPVEPADIAEAERRGWPVRRVTTLSASEALGRIVVATRTLSLHQVAQAFVAGVGGSAPRGRQVLISYAWALHLPGAIAAAAPALPDCGLREPVRIDFTEELMRLAAGIVWNESPHRYLPDLEAAAAEGLPAPTTDDRARFDALIGFIAAQPGGVTPGLLEKDLGRAGILPGTDKYARYGILQGLAETGVMPNALIPPSLDRHVPRAEHHAVGRQVRGSPRSDIVLPLAGWRSDLGVDLARLDAVFPRTP